MSSAPKLDLDLVYAVFNKWLAVDSTLLIDILAGFWLAHRLGGDPIWLIIVGPSSDGKTEYLRAFSDLDAVAVDKVTRKTIVSGYEVREESKNGEPKPKASPFAKELNNRVWIIYDFSQILAMGADDRGEVMAQMRDLYDGHIEARYGTGKKVSLQNIYVSMIGASTSDFEHRYAEQQALGTRHLLVRTMPVNSERLLQKVPEQEGKERVMRDGLRSIVTTTFKDFVPERVKPDAETTVRLNELLHILCTLRTHVSLDRYTGEVNELCEREGYGRAKKVLDKLYAGIMNIEGYTPSKAIDLIRHVVMSNVPRIWLSVLELLVERETITATQLSDELRIGYNTARRHLDQLYTLHVIDRVITPQPKEKAEWEPTPKTKHKYTFSSEWRDRYRKWFMHE